MAELANSQLIVRNTFLHFVVDDAAEELQRIRRSYSDHCIDYVNLGHKTDDECCCNFSDSTSAAGTSCEDSVPCTSRTSSDVGSDDVGCLAEVASGPPGIFTSQDGTTVIVRKVPNNVSRAEFIDKLDAEGFARTYSFVYLPMNFEKNVALGYAIVNFSDPAAAAAAVLHLPGVELSGKRLEASISEAKQSLSDLILRYRDSSVMHSSVPDDCKPVLFSDGLVVPFPKPTTIVDPPVLAKDKKKSQRSARSM